MNNFEKPGTYWDQTLTINKDAALQKFMNDTYAKMGMGVAFSGIIAFFVSNTPALAEMIIGSGITLLLFLALLGLSFVAPKIIMSKSISAANAVFWIYSGIWGIILAPYLLMYTQTEVATAFLSASIAFAGMSLWGYTTKNDLSPIGRIMGMLVIGLIAAMLLNFFIFQSGGMSFIISLIVVAAFSLLAAYETQNLKNMYLQMKGQDDAVERMGILGALSMYSTFVTLFIHILNIIGLSRD